MSTLVSFVSEVESAVASGDPTRHVETLRRMTDLFVEQAPHIAELHVSVFDEVILRLARDIEFRARVELSERLSDVANAPRKIVRELAHDETAEVAGPVLARSTRLAEEDLVAIAQSRGQDHLLALSRRTSLGERVTDVLVERGNERVVRSVAGNEGARFSVRGFDTLVERARADHALQGILTKRQDLPPRQMQALVEIARAQVRDTLGSEFGAGADSAVETALGEAAAAVAERGLTRGLVDDYGAAQAAVERQARAKGGQLAEDDVAAWLKAGQVEEALAALAQLAGIKVEMVARAYHATHYDPLLFIVRAVRFGWGTFKLLLTVKAGRQPPAEVLRSAFEAFQQLSVQTAQRVVRFTVVRESAQSTDAA